MAVIEDGIFSQWKFWTLKEDTVGLQDRAHAELEANQVSLVSLNRMGRGRRCSWEGMWSLGL